MPVSARNLPHPRRDMALVAAAGPLCNLAQALAWGLILKFVVTHGSEEGTWLGLRMMATAGVIVNLVLIALNVIPLPPLDGSRIVAGLLPSRAAYQYSRLEPYGLFILIGLMVFPPPNGMLGALMRPTIAFGQALLSTVLGF